MDKITHGVLDCVPKFILEDRNGYALARTMDVLATRLCRDIEAANVCLTDPEKMPEWALDEYAYGHGMAWYDRTADIEVKRRWVMEAYTMRYCIGTKDAIRHLLLGFYDSCDVEENWEYGGKPYHFRVMVSGAWDQRGDAWTRKVLDATKNLRSVLDELSVGSTARIEVHAQGEITALVRFPLCGEMLCGEWPET